VLNRGDTAAALARFRPVVARWAPRWFPTPAAVNAEGTDAMAAAVGDPGQRAEHGEAAYRRHAMATLAELGYPMEVPDPDTGFAVVQINKGRQAAVMLRHHARPLTFAMITEVLASARPSGIPTLLVANQPVTLAAAELAADTGSFEIVRWTGEYENDELVRGLTNLAKARHRR